MIRALALATGLALAALPAAGFLPQAARWTNRPTFQQMISLDSHGPR